MLRDLHYGWPWASFFTTGAILLLLLFIRLYRYRRTALRQFAFDDTLAKISVSRSPALYWMHTACFCLAWVFGVIAMMQPLANGHYPKGALPKEAPQKEQEATVRRKAHEIVLLLDASSSMAIKDTRTGQTRLDYAKSIGDEIVSRLSGETVSLYAFTSELTPLSPPTLDYLFVRLMLNEAQINEGNEAGTDYVAVLVDLRKRLLEEPLKQLKTIILLSDGGDTRIEALRGPEKQKEISGLLPLVADGKLWNMRLYSVGFGSKKGGIVPQVTFEGHSVHSAQEEEVLSALSSATQGKYYDSEAYSVASVVSELIKQIEKAEAPLEEQHVDNAFLKLLGGDSGLVYDHYFQIPLGFALFFLLMALYLPDVRFSKRGWFLLLIFIPWNVEGGMREAVIYREAKLYPESIQTLQALLKEKPGHPQEGALLYDIGTLYLYQKEWDTALAAFAEVPLDEDPSPLLVMHTKTNVGIAYLEKGRALAAEEEVNLNKVLYCYRSALRAFDEAEKAACLIKNLVESPACQPLGDLPALKRLAAEESAKVSKKLPESKHAGTLNSDDKPDEQDPASALENLLNEQGLALEATASYRQSADTGQTGQETWQLWKRVEEAQQKALASAAAFPAKVVVHQTKAFRGSKPPRCQARPWDEVLPLYEEGLRSAQKAAALLIGSAKHMEEAVILQEKASQVWERALAKLRSPVDPKQEGCQGDQQQPSDKNAKQEEKTPQTGTSTGDVLRLLQELEKQDRLPKSEQIKPKQGSRPW